MRSIYWLATALVVLFVLGVCAFAYADPISQSGLNTQIDQTDFVVNRNCSGTLISRKKGLILTANHCVASMFEDVKVEQANDKGEVKEITKRVAVPGEVSQLDFAGGVQTRSVAYRYDVLARDEGTDLALLKLPAKLPNFAEVNLACKAPERGDKVYAVGNPFVVLYASLTTGIVSSVDRSYGMLGIDSLSQGNSDKRFTQFTAQIAPGNSGGALLNDSGFLVGVVVRGGFNIGLAVAYDDVKAFLKANNAFDGGTENACPTS